MNDFVKWTLFSFMALFPILNPPAMAPVFMLLTKDVSEDQRHKLSRLIGFYTFILLTSLLLVGGWMLKMLGISVPVIGIAGGLLLFHTAWHMLNKDPRLSESEEEEIQTQMLDKAFFPLTLPVTAGPGSIAVTLTMVPNGSLLAQKTLLRFLAVICGIALASLTVYLFYRFSGNFLKRLGKTGQATISQVSAFILLAIGVQIIWNGIKALMVMK